MPVAAFRPPALEGFGIAMLSAELEYVQKRRTPTQTELDASTLAKHILSRYAGQVRRGMRRMCCKLARNNGQAALYTRWNAPEP